MSAEEEKIIGLSYESGIEFRGSNKQATKFYDCEETDQIKHQCSHRSGYKAKVVQEKTNFNPPGKSDLSSLNKSSGKSVLAGKDLNEESQCRTIVNIEIKDRETLYDPEASCAVMGEIAVHLASVSGKQNKVHTEEKEKVNDNRKTSIASCVILFSEDAGITRDNKIAVINELDANCYLRANFVRRFEKVFDLTTNQLQVEASGETIHLEVAAVGVIKIETLISIGQADTSFKEIDRYLFIHIDENGCKYVLVLEDPFAR